MYNIDYGYDHEINSKYIEREEVYNPWYIKQSTPYSPSLWLLRLPADADFFAVATQYELEPTKDSSRQLVNSSLLLSYSHPTGIHGIHQ